MSLMRAAWLRPRWLFNRRAAKALLWTVVLATVAVGANIVGIYLVGSVAGWERWLAAAAGYFLVWRLCLYGATAYGWVWMRRRLLAREDDAQARRRLVRSEIAGVVAIVALEASLLMQG
jgi:sterol desaturase/sphingolipid hydroxylase (fatty acid hydroxylase superfamily)